MAHFLETTFSFGDSLASSGIGFLIVFIGLICLIALVSLMGAVCQKVLKDEKKPAKKAAPAAPATAQGKKGAKSTGHLNDAKDALLVLGYSRSEVANALTGVDPTLDTEDIIRLSLAKLMK